MTHIPIETKGGIYLPEADLWLDPHRKKPHAFVSHAHADHFARHDTILCSPTNAALLRARYGGKRVYEELPFGEPLQRKGHTILLAPAGHALGSAMIKVTRDRDGASLLYTGDFKTRPGLSAEAPGILRADTVIMETTFGLPKYKFPPLEDIRARAIEFSRAALDEGAVPILLGYSFGKAQEILAMLHGTDFEVALHNKAIELLPPYQNAGIPFPEFGRIDPDDMVGKVHIAPPGAKLREPKRLKIRRAMFSGWGIDPSAKYRYGVDEVFPLSDHADYGDSIAFVKAVAPKRVLTTHGYEREFASDLRRLGYDAWSMGGVDQLEFCGGGF